MVFSKCCVLHLLESELIFYGNFSMRNTEIEVSIATLILLLISISTLIPISLPLVHPIPTHVMYVMYNFATERLWITWSGNCLSKNH